MAVAQKLACQVEKVIHHCDHVYTVDLRPERPAPRFRPGQFLHLALDTYDPSGFWPESRVFSIASPPTQRERLRITYSVQGRFTARMERELAKDQWVWIKLPYGEFVVEDTRDAILLAGGTGITAFTAFLDGLTHEFQHAVYLAYGARQRDLLIYRDMVEQRTRMTKRLHAFYFIESETGELQPHEAAGRLSVDAIWPWVPNPSEAIYYVSGPPPMLKTITQDLRSQGIRADAIRIDAWE